MKNTTAKHHNIEHDEGMYDEKYQLKYTTSPKRSYVVKPDEGEINYEKYSPKRTDKLVEKILSGTVEAIKVKE